MPDIWIDVDANLGEVPVNLLPLLDDTDFKSIEGGVAYDAAGMALRWHFVTTAGAYSVTSVTPTTSGAHDWTDQGDSGIYTIEIPSTGGTINNDTEGFGWFTGSATGILPWRGPVIGFRAAGLNNLLIDDAYSTTRGLSGTALPAAAADAAGGLPISDAGGLDMDAILSRIGTPANLGGGTATLAGNLVDIEGQTDDIGAAGAGLTVLPTKIEMDAAFAALDTSGDIADAVLDEATAGHTTAGTAGKALIDILAGSLTSATAAKLIALLTATPSGAVVDDDDPNPSATAFETDLNMSSDGINDAFCVFTSGALLGQSQKVGDWNNSTKVLTTAAFTAAPAAGDTFLIIGKSA